MHSSTLSWPAVCCPDALITTPAPWKSWAGPSPGLSTNPAMAAPLAGCRPGFQCARGGCQSGGLRLVPGSAARMRVHDMGDGPGDDELGPRVSAPEQPHERDRAADPEAAGGLGEHVLADPVQRRGQPRRGRRSRPAVLRLEGADGYLGTVGDIRSERRGELAERVGGDRGG